MGSRAKGECSIRACRRPRYGANYCRNHLGQANNGTLNEPTGRGRMKKQPETCGIKDCDGKAVARNLCMKHYGRWRRAGGIRLQPNFVCLPVPRSKK
ncbi:hypothetical protein LMG27198_32980 [Methylocystis echinoides]|uniref:Vegetative protein n=1 Tax=Methylocystis echinoides TaxID=29468 RepID=A0A9W6GWN0_9HYPH|nr:hypothetical protein LMG27198_32980 [Methylocystis echinoides]